VLGGLPSPQELAKRGDKPRTVSGANAPQNRLLQSEGLAYVSDPGWSANAEASGSSALIHGHTDALSFVLYRINTPLVDDTDTLTDLRLDYNWDTPPVDPQGLYVGLADLTADPTP
jgi:hypothetical protein